MKIDPRRGRILILTEPIGIVRAIGSLLLACGFLSACRWLLALRLHEHGTGIESPSFWFFISIAMVVLGAALSSPPRWRWVFDADINQVRSFVLRFNVPEREGESAPIVGLDRAEIIETPDGLYEVEVIDIRDNRLKITGMQSSSPGWPRTTAFKINEFIAEFSEQGRTVAHLNDPGVTLREAGIIAPIDSILVSLALEELQQRLSSELQRIADHVQGAYDLTSAMANTFFGKPVDTTDLAEFDSLTPLQQVLLFDLCVPALRKMHHAQFLSLAAIVEQPDGRRLRDSTYTSALTARFHRYVAKTFRVTSVEPPSAIDLSGVIPECRKAIATVATFAHSSERPLTPPRIYEGREVVFADPNSIDHPSSLAVKAYEAGLDELSSGMSTDWVAPATTSEELLAALCEIEKAAPIPMRNVLMRACARAATDDDIVEARVWLLLRVIADTLSLTVPAFVPEPISEVRLKAAR